MSQDSEGYLLRAGFVSGTLAVVFFLVLLLEAVFGQSLSSFGNFPRSFWGLLGIATSPLIHQDITHLLGNLLSVCGGIFLVGLLYPDILGRILTIVWLSTGVLVWVFARPAYHIGSSGVGYGIVFFLFFVGLLRKDKNSVVISLLILLTQSTMIVGWLPTNFTTSYESHAAGIVVGTFVAILYYNRYPKANENTHIQLSDEEFMPPPPHPKITITPKEIGSSYSVQYENQDC